MKTSRSSDIGGKSGSLEPRFAGKANTIQSLYIDIEYSSLYLPRAKSNDPPEYHCKSDEFSQWICDEIQLKLDICELLTILEKE